MGLKGLAVTLIMGLQYALLFLRTERVRRPYFSGEDSRASNKAAAFLP
jgi:hypothetical protein